MPPGSTRPFGVPVVDVHHHWLPEEIVRRLREFVDADHRVESQKSGLIRISDPAGTTVMTVEPEKYTSPRVQLDDMDATGIDVAILSASCFPSWLTMRAARLLNDASADLQRNYPTRFVPLAHVPPLGEPGILEELDRCARELGLRGVSITTNFRGKYPDADEYRPFLRKAAELDLPVFVHAAGAPAHPEVFRQYDLGRTLGRSFEHCAVVIRLLYSGVMREIPGLRLVMPHLGGAFFVNVKRFFESPRQLIHEVRAGEYEEPLDRMLFDTAPSFWYGPNEIGCAVTNLGVSRVALGSDYPAYWDRSVLRNAVAHIDALPVSKDAKAQLVGLNTLRFYALESLLAR
jgi:predicted TIM-barrel fold metal-dependent hydrolase